MSFLSAPLRVDQDARALRERLELLALGDDDRACAEAARQLVAFCADHPEYRLCALIPEMAPAQPETARRIQCKHGGPCGKCGKPVRVGDECFWTPGDRGVFCLACRGKA